LAPNPPDKVVECAATIAPAASGLCDVKQGTKGTLLRGSVLLEDQVLHKGEVLVAEDGTITCASCDCSGASGYADATVVACADGVISPGLINAHDHITFSNNKPAQHGTERYEQRHDWRKGLRGHKKITAGGGASANVVLFAELRFLMSGATSTVGSGGRAGLLRNLDEADPAEYHGAPIQQADFDTFPLDDSAGTQLETGCAYGSARTTKAAIAADEGYLPHIAEGIDKVSQNELACTSSGDFDLMQRQTAVIHAIATNPAQAALMRQRQTAVVWSPRSNVDLYGNTAPVTLLDAEGVMIALGTDWMPSGSMNLARELRCADDLNQKYYGKHFSDADLWRMATVHAAYAAGAQRVLGSIAPGKVADLTVFDGRTAKDHRAVLEAGIEGVALVMRGGTPLYGDVALMDAVGASACEPMGDVCGAQRKACVQKDVGTATLAAVRSAGEAIYPLFFCKGQAPTNEPSCTPYRATYPGGISGTDKDGDGIDDAKDLCPSVFDPIRPMDGTAQADTDGDGIGDACDTCPRDAANACTRPDARDIDGDGVRDGSDVCPEIADPSQADSDGDGVGDACDPCPGFKNPGATPCPVTIAQLRDPNAMGHVPERTIVSLPAAWVTNAVANDFWMQDGSQQPWTGVQVHTGTRLLPARGNQVKVEGVYTSIFGMSAVIVSRATVTDPGTALPFGPSIVSTADLKTGGSKALSHQSMLVEVDSLTITNAIPDGANNKFYEFVVNSDLRIDDRIWVRYGTPANAAYPVTGFTNATTFQKIVGIHGFSFGDAKLWPRDTNDVVR
jgi:cytosine/adenosine deaminase-related metal-dependent hydrolase